MSDEILVKVEGVSKKFCRSLKKSLWYGVGDIMHDLNPFSRNAEVLNTEKLKSASGIQSQALGLRDGEFWAVSDVSFEVRRGECLGLIGRNGAGKTTLLKILNGLIKPDGGKITMRGRVGALIALGAGFNPILTGRENIYVNGSVLGLKKKEIDVKLDDIIDFADIHDFIDSPVQSYSSGMQVRLGFAVATAMEPDVLLLDEVLAVGDAAFRMKCYNTIGGLLNKCAVIFVSHSMDQVARICTKVAVMRNGKLLHCGAVQEAIRIYDSENSLNGQDGAFEKWNTPLTDVFFSLFSNSSDYGQNLTLLCRLNSTVSIYGLNARLQFFDDQGAAVGEGITHRQVINVPTGSSHLTIQAGPLHFRRGKYTLSIILLDNRKQTVLAWNFKKLAFEIFGDDWGGVSYRPPLQILVEPSQSNLYEGTHQ